MVGEFIVALSVGFQFHTELCQKKRIFTERGMEALLLSLAEMQREVLPPFTHDAICFVSFACRWSITRFTFTTQPPSVDVEMN